MTIYDVVILGVLVVGALDMLSLVIEVCLIIIDWLSDLRSKRNDSCSNINNSDDAGIN